MSLIAGVLRRLCWSVLSLLGILLFNFLLLHAAGGDAADVLAGESGAADAAYVAALRQRFGLDRPLPVQFAAYVGRLALGDFGYSFHNGAPVLRLIGDRLPATVLLSGSALALAAASGILLGGIAAARANTWLDEAISWLASLGYAMPLFWAGLMLVVLFAVRLGWLPSGGYEDFGAGHTGLARLADILRHLMLPMVTLALFTTALATRIMRTSMRQVLRSDYVRTAHAVGLSRGRVLFRAALPNAVLPLVTVMGLQVASLMGGAVLVETVFAWPGLGRLAFDAVVSRDLNLLLGLLLLSSVVVTLTNLLVDAVHAWLDPPDAGCVRALMRRYVRRKSAVLGALLVLAVVLAAASADLVYPDDPWDMAAPPLLWPGEDPAFPLGSDTLGRDISAGLFHGARASLLVGGISALAAVLVGTSVGAVAGYCGGGVDTALMRVTEMVQTMPPFLFSVVLVAILGPDLDTIVLALTAISWPAVARLVRGEFLRLRGQEFVQSCTAMGMGHARIIVRHILPNAMPVVIVMTSVTMAGAILTEAGLSFLGLGDPNIMTWGTMIGLGRDTLRTAWYMAAIPGTAVMVTVLGLNLVGEGLNDALMPGGDAA